MIGLLVLVVGAIYLAVLVFATGAAYRWAARKGLPKSKRMLAAAGGFLVVYLPVFWDHIPTLVMHKYYCEKEAGFWVYKTLELWKTENPGVMEKLIFNNDAPSTRVGDMKNYSDTYFLNQRFEWIVRKAGPLPFQRWRWEQAIVDTRTNEVLARYVDFSTGDGFLSGPQRLYKSWLQNNHCSGGERNDSQMRQFKINLRGTQK